MARVEAIELTGFRELEQSLRQLPKATGKNVLRRVAKGALEPMAQIAASKAPHRTGRLAYSITVSEKRTRRAKKSTTRFVGGGFRAAASKGIEMAMGPAGGLGTLQYASFDEFGTIDTPAFGYMRAAWDGGAYNALDYVKGQLSVEIDKSTAKFLKKQGRL
jgi:HK97 gp10 family phage protein